MPDSSFDGQLRPFNIGSFTIRWLRRLAPLLLIGLAVHLLLPQLANMQDAWETVQQMPGRLVFLAGLAQIVSYSGSGYLLAALAALLNEHLPIFRGTLITLASASIGLVAGGLVGSSAATYRWTAASGVSRQGAGLCSTLPSLINNFLLAVIATVGLLHLLFIHQLTPLQGISFVLILAFLLLLIGGGLWGVAHPSWLQRMMTRIGEWWAKIRKRLYSPAVTANRVNMLLNTWIILRRGGWRGPAVGAVVYMGCDMLTLTFLFMAAGHPVSPGVLLAGYGLPLLLGKISFLPGGVGIVEATMTAIYVSLGVPPHMTVVVTLVYRLFSFWIPTLLGFPLSLYLQHTTRQVQQPTQF